MNSRNLHKASGFDNTSFLRLGNEILAPILSFYFGPVFKLGIFPKFLKLPKLCQILNLVTNI